MGFPRPLTKWTYLNKVTTSHSQSKTNSCANSCQVRPGTQVSFFDGRAKGRTNPRNIHSVQIVRQKYRTMGTNSSLYTCSGPRHDQDRNMLPAQTIPWKHQGHATHQSKTHECSQTQDKTHHRKSHSESHHLPQTLTNPHASWIPAPCWEDHHSLQAGLWLHCVWLSIKHGSTTTGQHP